MGPACQTFIIYKYFSAAKFEVLWLNYYLSIIGLSYM